MTSIPPNTVHGCVTGTTRTLERVYTNPASGVTCPAGTFQVIMPSGADTDASSSPVTAGPSGLDAQEVLGLNSTQSSLAQCPDTHPYVLGGGYRLVTGNNSVTPLVLYSIPNEATPSNAGSWAVFIESNGVSSVTAYAICAK